MDKMTAGRALCMCLGMVLGMAIGWMIGRPQGKMGIMRCSGLVLGMAAGLAAGVLLDRARKDKDA